MFYLGGILATLSVTAGMIALPLAVLPLVVKYNKTIKRKVVFSNCIEYPRNLNYDSPSSCDIIGGENFTIEFDSKVDNCPVRIGCWHIVPRYHTRDVVVKETPKLDTASRLRERLETTQDSVLLYFHGNSNHRASPHRLYAYSVFQEMNCHVITFDYRGYGDSTRVRPTEQGVVEDALQVYAWLHDSIPRGSKRPFVIFWGHSLGTAVAAHLLAKLPELCSENLERKKFLPYPDAFILEAPFNNLMDEITRHPFSKIVRWLPYFDQTIVAPFKHSSEYKFCTDDHLACLTHVPVLILHAKGDRIVPYELAVKLYRRAHQSRLATRSGAPLVLHAFGRGRGLGHNNLCRADDIDLVVGNFLTITRRWKPPGQKPSSNTKSMTRLSSSNPKSSSPLSSANTKSATELPSSITKSSYSKSVPHVWKTQSSVPRPISRTELKTVSHVPHDLK